MATEKTIIINAKTDKAVKEVDKLNKETSKVGESAEKSEKGVKGLGKGFKVLGTAMKAAGIGLIVALVAKLTQAFTQNQKVMDAVNSIFTTINIVFTEVTTAIINAFESVSKANNGFEALGKTLKGLITLALTPLKVQFFGIKLAIEEAQLIWEKSFLGDGDTTTIKEINESIAETKQSLKDVGTDAIQATKDIKNNIGEAAGSIVDFGSKAIDEISKVNVSAAKAQADRLTEARKAAQLAQVEIQGLIEKYDREAEIQRQIRDDERLSINDRIKANDELNKILEKQLQEQLKLANERVNAAELEISATGDRIENEVALKEAKNEVAAIEAQITGFQSEQRVNEAALQQERIDNLEELRLIGKSEVERQIAESENELERQKRQIERTVEDEKEKFRLLRAAEKEHNERVAEIENEETQKELERIKQKEALLREFENETAIQKLEREEAENIAELERLEGTEAEKQRIREFYSKKRDELEKKSREQQAEEEKANLDLILTLTANSFSQLTAVLGEQSKAGKAFAVAEALINTFKGITAGLGLGFPFSIPAVAFAAKTGFAAVKNILSTKPSSSGGSVGGAASSASASTSAASQVQAPQFNVVGDAGTNQIASTLNEQNENPARAYVVSREMSSQQELDRNIETDSSLG